MTIMLVLKTAAKILLVLIPKSAMAQPAAWILRIIVRAASTAEMIDAIAKKQSVLARRIVLA